MDIKEDKHFQDFLKVKNYRPTSEVAAYQRLKKYCTHLNKTPTQLIEEAEQEEDQRLRMKKRHIKSYFTDFLDFLIKNNYSESYIKTTMAIVRTFYREYDIELPHQTVRLPHQNNKFTTDDIIQKSHIQQAVQVADPKWAAIILTMASSGMGSSELRSITMQDFKNGLSEIGINNSHSIRQIKTKVEKNSDALILWKIRRVKTNFPYYCFSSPEALSYIMEYLTRNPQYGRKYLFTNNQGGQITHDMMTYHFQKINNLAGFGQVDGRNFFHSHGLRSFFASTLYKAGLPQLTIDFFLGHKINPTTQSYFKSDIGKLRQEYLKILPEVTFTEPVKVRVLTDERLEGANGSLTLLCKYNDNKNYFLDRALSWLKPSMMYFKSSSFNVCPFCIAYIFSSLRVPASIRTGICTILSGSSGIVISLWGFVSTSIFSPLNIFTYLFLCCYCYIFLPILLFCYHYNNITTFIYYKLQCYFVEGKKIFYFFLLQPLPFYLSPTNVGETKGEVKKNGRKRKKSSLDTVPTL